MQEMPTERAAPIEEIEADEREDAQ
jgi:hypothetical protein